MQHFCLFFSIEPCHYARLAYFLHPKLRENDAVLSTPQLITLPLRHLWRQEALLGTTLGPALGTTLGSTLGNSVNALEPRHRQLNYGLDWTNN